MTPLESLASRCGIALTSTDGEGRPQQVPRATLTAILRALGFAAEPTILVTLELAPTHA